MAWTGVAAGAALLLVLWISWVLASALVAPPRTRARGKPSDLGLAFEEVSFRDPRGRLLRGWFVPSPRGDGRASIFTHGNGDNREMALAYARAFAEAGFHLLAFDFAGRGDSDGTTISLGWHEREAVKAAVAWLASRPEVDAARIGLVGHSMGAAAGALAAPEEPRLAALVLDSSFASLDRLCRETMRRLPFPAWPFVPLGYAVARLRAGFDPREVEPAAALARAETPVLVVHGLEDSIVSPQHARALQDAAAGPKELLLVPGVGHNDPRPATVERRILAFLEAHLGPRGDRP